MAIHIHVVHDRRPMAKKRFCFVESVLEYEELTKKRRIPIFGNLSCVGALLPPSCSVKSLNARHAGEELPHRGLFEVALLGDELIQSADQNIHIAQRCCDGALLNW